MDSNTFETQSKTNIDASRDAPLTWTLASSRSKSNIINNVFERLKESWPYVLNPKYTTPTSLPLCFFFWISAHASAREQTWNREMWTCRYFQHTLDLEACHYF